MNKFWNFIKENRVGSIVIAVIVVWVTILAFGKENEIYKNIHSASTGSIIASIVFFLAFIGSILYFKDRKALHGAVLFCIWALLALSVVFLVGGC